MLQGLLGVAGSGINAASLVSTGDWSAVPATLPVVALAFVYHNIVPMINTALEGDVTKIRTAVVAGRMSSAARCWAAGDLTAVADCFRGME